MLGTVRLYQQDAYLSACTADLMECRQTKDGFALLLDQTIFHPKGGGQPSDRGSIAGQPLLDVVEQGDEVLHIVAQRPEQERGLALSLDFPFRYDLMQQHTGQHVLSTVIDNLFQSDTGIFRSEERICQIDLAKPLTEAQLEQAEAETNRLLAEGRAVRSLRIGQEEIPRYQLKMRLPIAPHEVVQLVEIEQFDLIGCGGTHVRNTREVGFVKILTAKHVGDQKTAKGAMRVYFVCGGRAMEDYSRKNRAFYELSALLGGEPDALPDQVKALKQQADAAQAKAQRLEQQLLQTTAERLLAQAGGGDVQVVSALLEGFDVKALKALSELLTAGRKTVVLLGSDNGEQISVVLGQSKGATAHNLSDLLKPLMEETGGKGGGGAGFAQATLPGGFAAKQSVERRLDQWMRSLC